MTPIPEAERPAGARLALLTALALVAFAGNSLLCRAALRAPGFDPARFTAVRLISGAVALALITRPRNRIHAGAGSWPAAIALFVYAAAFSWAYLRLTAGTGALLLFGAVQATMNLAGWRSGERLGLRQFAGLGLAFVGLGVLVAPGLAAPPLGGAILMLGAGVAWGIYSLRGRGSRDPLGETAANFLRAALLGAGMLLVVLLADRTIAIDRNQFLPLVYAAVSGALASGVGYAIWYTALRGLTATRAALVQLAVPPLAALGGILLLGEAPTLRLAGATLLILGGIALGVLGRKAAA
ncbi:MAG TPA: DMT family transporter [Thermoanaerobaculia bacterium]|jgi:drug/metabolite transporter (DMT)-like permease|nr:DMT family transporter [Thermoanaerobaculia bacterium]